MNYELARALKDAGFPQKPGTYVAKNGTGGGSMEWLTKTVGLEDPCYSPNLSELIEACGEGFVGLDRTDDGWRATGFKEASDITEGFILGEGSTPEEAVARLWLALNKHETKS